MKKPLILKKEKLVKASASRIWEVITTPRYFSEWMLVPGTVPDNKPLSTGSKVQWTNEEGVVYLEGEVIAYIPSQKLIISLQDISWKNLVPKGTVTYEFHLAETKNGTMVRFYLGDLSVDPESEIWYDAYNASDEIGAIEQIISKT